MIKRGEIYFADLGVSEGSEQSGKRPVIILQNDIGNKHAPTTIIAPITSRTTKAKLPTQVWLSVTDGFRVDSMVMCEQIRTIAKSRLVKKIGQVQEDEMRLIDEAVKISLGVE